MPNTIKAKKERAVRRAKRVRARMHGTKECPRLSVHRSLKHIRCQLIDDNAGITLASASDKDVAEKAKPVEIAKAVGAKLAEKAKAAGIDLVVFDRGSNRYTGRVAALADGAREGGLIF